MCGIAGLIHRGKSSDVGKELQDMLQALKHRGPDSTGYALYNHLDYYLYHTKRIPLNRALYV